MVEGAQAKLKSLNIRELLPNAVFPFTIVEVFIKLKLNKTP